MTYKLSSELGLILSFTAVFKELKPESELCKDIHFNKGKINNVPFWFFCMSGFRIYAEETKKNIDRIHPFSMRKDRIS